MRKRLILSLAAMALYVGGLFAQQNIIAPQNRVASSFAIFIDDKSYEACEEAVMAYKKNSRAAKEYMELAKEIKKYVTR